jgi:glutaredoxin-like protein NrdH
MTTNFLERSDRPYVKIDVTEDEAAFKYITEELGYLQVPVVTTSGGDNWSGFRPDRLAELV